MVDYFMDISYGAMNLSHSDVYPADDRTEWYDCGYKSADSPRGDVVDPFDGQTKEARQVLYGAAVRASKVDLAPYHLAVALFDVDGTATGGSSAGVTTSARGTGPVRLGGDVGGLVLLAVGLAGKRR